MRKEIITCDRCKAEFIFSYPNPMKKPEHYPRIVKKREICELCYEKFLEVNTWFDKEMEKWLDGKESGLDNV